MIWFLMCILCNLIKKCAWINKIGAILFYSKLSLKQEMIQ